MFRSFRNLFFLMQAIKLLFPLFRKGRVLKFPFLLKEMALLALTQPELIGKFLEKYHLSPQFLKQWFKSKSKIK